MNAGLLRFEWRYHTRQMSFVAACALFALFGFAFTATEFGPKNIDVNSPFSIMQSAAVLSLVAVFVLAVFAANATIRDRDFKMEEIVYSTAIAKRDFLLTRFFGALAAALTAFLCTYAGMIAALYAVDHDPARVAPFRVLPYVWSLLVMALPNLLLAALLLFVVALLTRSMLATSVAAAVLYVLYFAVSAWTNSPLMAQSSPGMRPSGPLTALLDPFGLTAFFQMTEHWLAAERNAQLLPLTGVFLVNRLLWLAIAASFGLVVYRRFALRQDAGLSARRGVAAVTVESAPASGAGSWTAAPVKADVLTAFRSAVRLDLRAILRSRAFIALALLWIGLGASEVLSEIASAEYGSTLIPTTGIVLSALHAPLHVLLTIIVAWYGAEMMWRERSSGMHSIVDSTPVGGGVLVLAKWSALSLFVATLVLIGQATGLVIQWARGSTAIDWAAMPMFALIELAPWLLFSAAIVLIHRLVGNKYVGVLLSVAVIVLGRQGSLFGVEHPLLRFGFTPDVLFSDFYRFGPFAIPFVRYFAHWSLLAMLLLLIAAYRWREASTDRRKLLIASALLTLFFAGSTLALYQRTNVSNDYATADAVERWRVDYERTYSRYAAMTRPRITSTRAVIDLDPQTRSYSARGESILRNDGSVPISTILVSADNEARVASLRIDGGESRVDERFGQHIVTLQRAMAPGESRALHFDVRFSDDGFGTSGLDTSIVPNGSFVASGRLLPRIGYRRGYELSDPARRARLGLPAVPLQSDEEDEAAQDGWAASDFTLRVPSDQIGVTSGRLVAEWNDGARRCFRYVVDRPAPTLYGFVAGRYDVLQGRSGDVDVRVYASPLHRANARRVLRAAEESVALFARTFGPYAHRELHVVEVPAPGNGFGGLARPGVIFLNENRALLLDARREGGIDLLTRRTAHEVAHQWFGVGIAASGPGASVLAETITKYAELLMVEKKQGREAVELSLQYELDLYLRGRAAASEELPLSRATDESYLFYRKGAIVMWRLHELLGEERLNAALRGFYAEYGGVGKKPTVAALVAELQRGASADQAGSIDAWFNRVEESWMPRR